MLLAVDIGNTQTVIGLVQDGRISQVWRLATVTSRTADELQVLIREMFRTRGVSDQGIDTVVIASVVPALTAAFEEIAASIAGKGSLVVGPGLRTGLRIELDNPREVGADRIANAVAAKALYGQPSIVVDFGTATNIDIISREGTYLGGVISPGLETSANALFEHAARLSAIDLEFPPSPVGRSTRTAVQSGLMFGEAAKVDGLVRSIWEELGYQTPVVATGGLSSVVAPHCQTVTAVDGDLTIKGLHIIAETHFAAKRGGSSGD